MPVEGIAFQIRAQMRILRGNVAQYHRRCVSYSGIDMPINCFGSAACMSCLATVLQISMKYSVSYSVRVFSFKKMGNIKWRL